MNSSDIKKRVSSGFLPFPFHNTKGLGDSFLTTTEVNSMALVNAHPVSRFSSKKRFKNDGELIKALVSLAGEGFYNKQLSFWSSSSQGTVAKEEGKNFLTRFAAQSAPSHRALLTVAFANSVSNYLSTSGEVKTAQLIKDGVASMVNTTKSFDSAFSESVEKFVTNSFFTLMIENLKYANCMSLVSLFSVTFTEITQWLDPIPDLTTYSFSNGIHTGESIPTFGPIGLTTSTFLGIPLGHSEAERLALLYMAEYLPACWYYSWLYAYFAYNWRLRGVKVKAPLPYRVVPSYEKVSFRDWFRKDLFPQQPGIEKVLLDADKTLLDPRTRIQYCKPFLNPKTKRQVFSHSATLRKHIEAIFVVMKDTGYLSQDTPLSSFEQWIVNGTPTPSFVLPGLSVFGDFSLGKEVSKNEYELASERSATALGAPVFSVVFY